MSQNDIVVRYKPAGKTIAAFHKSDAFVRALVGPLGSSKTTACCVEILKRAMEQKPGPDGIRRTRWAIIRNSYPELKSTTLKSWHEWAPASFGKVNMDSPFVHHIKTSEIDCEVLFLALDSPEDARKLLSLELTGAFLNEFREINKQILDTLTGRIGRMPSKNLGGPSWFGIVADSNPFDTQSDWYRLFVEECPADYKLFRQPSGLSPEAENVQNLVPNYYQRLLAGKSDDWIRVYIHGEFGFVVEGKPVFPQYRDSVHCASEEIKPDPHFGLVIGADGGLTPAAVIGQKLPDGRWLIVDELTTDNTGIKRFGELLNQYLAVNYPDFNVTGAWTDPSGDYGADNHDDTMVGILNRVTQWQWKPAPGENLLEPRLEVVRSALNRMVDGIPGILISPKCKMIRKGMANGYHFKTARSGNGAVLHEKPNKNEYSHPMEALQYLLLGGGEYDVVLNRPRDRKRNRPKFALGRDSFEKVWAGEKE